MRTVDVSKMRQVQADEAGSPAILQWLSIDSLVVDDSYQRELNAGNWKAIRRIAEQFRWSRFSPVFVAPVEGGRYAIIDGQHRTHAAALCGFEQVPCQIVHMSREEQAASFAAVNGLVTKVTGWQIYKAALAAGETWALACRKAVCDAGCRLMMGNNPTDMKQPREIYALGLVRGYVAAGKAELLTLALTALAKSEGGQEPTIWSNETLRPLLMAVTDRPWLIDHAASLPAFLDEFDIYAASDEAVETVKKKRRLGFIKISRWDIAAGLIGEALDNRFARKAAA